MHPPHQSKPNDLGRKITLKFGEDLLFFFGDHLILGRINVQISDFGRKITLNFGEDLFFFFFFFFFGDHLILGGKKFKFLISAEKSLSISKTTEFVLKILPHQNFLDPPLIARC